MTSALSPDSAQPHPLTEQPDEVTEYEYELDEKTGKTSHAAFLPYLYVYVCVCICVCVCAGERVVLGRGAFGTVYSAVDFVTKRKMAVKEIKETDSG